MRKFFNFIDLKEGASKQYSPLALAFVGDAVYELLVRSHLIIKGNQTAHNLHYEAIKYVKASAQAAAIKLILPLLTEEEETMYKRGRNANSAGVPKNADPIEYRKATGLETLFGYLFLENKTERMEELFKVICEAYEEEKI